jgi:hypothetical protein
MMFLLRASRAGAIYVLASTLVCIRLSSQPPAPQAGAVNPDSVLIADFEKQVKDYVKLCKKAEGGVPALKPTASAHEINQHRRLLVRSIQGARRQAKQGDIFSPEITREFKRLIAMAYQEGEAAKVRASLRSGESVNNVRVQVNALYPEHIPLQTMPPSILLNLPDLPKELDYRIVGRSLVLRDVGANLIVDYIPGAIPSS